MSIPPLYDPNTPENPSDFLADSQPDLQLNFQTLFDAFLKNHISLDAAALAGNHTIIELLQRSSSPQTDINEFSVYTKDVEGQTDQVFMRLQNNGTAAQGREFQFTNYQLYFLDLYNFFTFLPGKLIAYFGSFNTVAENTLPNNVLTLRPPVARVIVSVVTCPIGPTQISYKPVVNPVADKGSDFTNKLIFSNSNTVLGSKVIPCHYIIIAQF